MTFLMALHAPTASAELTIEVVGGGADRHVIAVPKFSQEHLLDQKLTQLIRQDLDRTGAFRTLFDPNIPPSALNNPQYPHWLTQGAMSIAAGQITPTPNGLTVEFVLMDAARKQRLTGASFTIQPNQMRQLAHRIADMIYEAITGHKGIASTRLAYVSKQPNAYLLQVSDWDGANAHTLLRSTEPIISPAWSPDGTRLAYVSFESHKPVVFVHNLATGTRYAAAQFKGSNSAPAWSPDGQHLAVVLTLSGHSQIYAVPSNGASSTPRRLSNSHGIDTEPVFTNDGRLFFTSDRAGGPQIYVMSTQGQSAQRLTFEGNYNVSPAPAPDNSALAFIRRENGQYRVMLYENGDTRPITDTQNDESPSFSPNSKMIVYANNGALYTISRDGQTKTKLQTAVGGIRAPAWGPYAH